MNTQFNSNVIWLQLEYKISTLEPFVWTVKGQNNLLVPGGFSDIIKIDQLEFKSGKILGFGTMQEKLENR